MNDTRDRLLTMAYQLAEELSQTLPWDDMEHYDAADFKDKAAQLIQCAFAARELMSKIDNTMEGA